jgi:hypothetical protein
MCLEQRAGEESMNGRVEIGGALLSRPTAVSDSILALIGSTPCVRLGRGSNLYLKLEGSNPTGSIADRLLLYAIVEGNEIHVQGDGPVCASAALLGAVLGLPASFECEEESPFLALAKAYGARRVSSTPTTVRFDVMSALRTLIGEIVDDIPSVSRIAFPATSPLRCETNVVFGRAITWLDVCENGREAHERLGRVGLMVDSASAACLGQLDVDAEELTVFVVSADGMLDYVGLEREAADARG